MRGRIDRGRIFMIPWTHRTLLSPKTLNSSPVVHHSWVPVGHCAWTLRPRDRWQITIHFPGRSYDLHQGDQSPIPGNCCVGALHGN
jgi:hypothetical protein